MIALLWGTLIAVAFLAVLTFSLVLVLARRLRAVTERVHMFLPLSEGRLPDPGTPVPQFSATAVDGERVGSGDLAGADRIVALLTTDCASCRDQVPALAHLDLDTWPQPIVVVIGPPAERSPMVAALTPPAIVIEEDEDGPLARAFDVHEFPAVMRIGQGVIHMAAHGLARVLESAPQPASA